MKRQGTRHHIDGLLMLLLFGVFAVCVLSVLLTGARAYRRLTQRDQEAYDRRTCVQYVATRVRQADVEGGITVEPFGEATALTLTDSEGYVTRVYWYDGSLMEVYADESAELAPEDGERIMALEGMSLSLEGDMLTVELVSAGGETDTLRLSLRCGEGAAG